MMQLLTRCGNLSLLSEQFSHPQVPYGKVEALKEAKETSQYHRNLTIAHRNFPVIPVA